MKNNRKNRKRIKIDIRKFESIRHNDPVLNDGIQYGYPPWKDLLDKNKLDKKPNSDNFDNDKKQISS